MHPDRWLYYSKLLARRERLRTKLRAVMDTPNEMGAGQALTAHLAHMTLYREEHLDAT